MSGNTLIFEFLDEYVNYWCNKLPITTSEVTQTEIISVCGDDYLTDENESPWRLVWLYDLNDGHFIGNYDTSTHEILFKQEDEKYTFSIPPTDEIPIKYCIANKIDDNDIMHKFCYYGTGYNKESEDYKKTDEILKTIFKNNFDKNQLFFDIYNTICNDNMTEHISYVIQQYLLKHILK